MKKIFALCSLVVLGACSQNWDVEGVANSPSEGTKFDKSLKHEYVELAIVERHFGDWDEVDRLLTKAIAAGEGNPAALEAPVAGYVKSEKGLKDLENSRTRLMAEYKKGARDKKPTESAQAQVAYECMVNAWSWEYMEDLEFCRELFEVSMASIQGKKIKKKEIALVKPGAKIDAKMQKTAKAKKSAIPASLRKAYMENGKSYMLKDGKYIIYYAFGEAKPAQDIDAMLKDVVMEYRLVEPQTVAVSGYTDTAGSVKINEALSLRRAKTVANALVKYGIEENKLDAKGFGEKDLAVPTADGVAEPKNRRTTIEFK